MNASKRCCIVQISMVVLVLSCAASFQFDSAEYEDWHVYKGASFSLCIPPGYHVQRHEPGVDYQLYSVISTSDNTTPLVGIYEGNHPDFGGVLPPTAPFEPIQRPLGRWTMTRVQWRSQRQHYYGEVAIERSMLYPNFLHFWYDGISQHEYNIVERIIYSLTLDKTACSLPQ